MPAPLAANPQSVKASYDYIIVGAGAAGLSAALAFALGERSGSPWMLAGVALIMVGVVLHLAERHAHEHEHDVLEHEHAHTHDDMHHHHEHAVMPTGPHSHWHRHEALRHVHPHVPDEHHTHAH